MIEVDERFEVPASPDVVWQLLADPYAVVGCVPGAAIGGQNGDGSLDTTLTVKFGPLSIGFQARAELDLDAARRSGTLTARGKDKQGGARFQASATFSVTPEMNESTSDATTNARSGDAVSYAGGEVRDKQDSTLSATSSASARSIVTVKGEVDISGRLASMIEAGAGVIVKRMSSEFADCLRARCAAAAGTTVSSQE